MICRTGFKPSTVQIQLCGCLDGFKSRLLLCTDLVNGVSLDSNAVKRLESIFVEGLVTQVHGTLKLTGRLNFP